MDFKEIVKMGLDEYTNGLRKALEGLSVAERRYKPSADSNHIDFLVWHIARVEDRWLHTFAQGARQVWQRDAWYQKLGLPEQDGGSGYTAEQVVNMPHFDMADCLAYYDAVRRDTLPYLEGLSPADLDRCPEPERRPGYSIGKMFSHILVEESQHVGQVAYLRGIQRGLNQ